MSPEVEIMSQQKSGGGGGAAVLVFLEQTNGVIEGVSLEALGKAREIADKTSGRLVGLLLGQDVREAAEECAKRGTDVILLGESPLLKEYTTEAYAKVITPVVKSLDPSVILVGATHNGTSLASALAVRLHAGLMAHVVDLEVEEGTGTLLGSVPGFGGSIVAVCRCRGRPQMATVKPGVFTPLPPDGSHAGVVTNVEVDLLPGDLKQTVVSKSVGEGPDISRAERIVVAGLGCGDDLTLAKRLAESLNAQLAVSRPVADKGIASKEMVVGSTGSGLNANLVIVLGVSGASHFTSGIRNAKSIVSINRDHKATIFEHSDYCVEGDVNVLLPKLASALESERGSERKA
jgi:electron transfer flavoprotein alpha subunit